MKLLGSYKNGNYRVSIFDDGTKIRRTEEDEFIAEFPENIDLKITDYCDLGCKFCHEDSTTSGKHAKFNHQFFTTLRPYTELAIGGGNPLDHPELFTFLQYLRADNIISNLTINQVHLENNISPIRYLVQKGLIKGLGVSLVNPTDSFISLIKDFPNAVIHTINGVTSIKSYEKLKDKNLKVLILGYKLFRRGEQFYSETVKRNISDLTANIKNMFDWYNVLSFDNLALEQLNIKEHLTKEQWDKFYMGDDGQHTMYIDLVNGVFAKNSTSKTTCPLLNSIDEMFKIVKES